MRLIDADLLIEKAKQDGAYDYVSAEEIANAPTIEAGWIPFSERFPREYAQYLVCFESGECHVYWLEDSDWSRGIVEKEGIIAWMPLPKPYREDGEK